MGHIPMGNIPPLPWGNKERMHKDPEGVVQMSLCLVETHSKVIAFHRATHSEQFFLLLNKAEAIIQKLRCVTITHAGS